MIEDYSEIDMHYDSIQPYKNYKSLLSHLPPLNEENSQRVEEYKFKSAGYPEYIDKYDVSHPNDIGYFLIWIEESNKLLNNYSADWSKLFNNEAYIEPWYSRFGILPSIPIASDWLLANKESDFSSPKERMEEYQLFINKLDLDNVPELQKISSLETFHSMLMRKSQQLIRRMKETDNLAQNVLKVFYYETALTIEDKTRDIEKRLKILSALSDSVEQTYNIHFFRFCFSTNDYDKILRDKLTNPFINNKILRSAINGLRFCASAKIPNVTILAGYYKKMLFTEIAINDILDDNKKFSLMSLKLEQKDIIITDREKNIIENILKNKISRGNRKRIPIAKEFYSNYIKIYKLNGDLGTSELLRTMHENFPDLDYQMEQTEHPSKKAMRPNDSTPIFDRTYRNWINYYNEERWG
jgi:hypothetical protein